MVLLRILWPIALLALASCSAAPVEESWEVLAEDAGIVITARTLPDRPLPIVRGRGNVQANLATVREILGDVTRHTEWMANCAESRVIGARDGTIWVYSRLEMTLPMSLVVWDRDVIVRVTEVVRDAGRVCEIRFEDSKTIPVPVPERVVRTPRIRGHYLLTSVSKSVTHVEYLVDVDPGGSLPDWAKRMGARGMPMETILGIREQARQRTSQ